MIYDKFYTSKDYSSFWRENMRFKRNGEDIKVEDLPPCKFTYVFEKRIKEEIALPKL